MHLGPVTITGGNITNAPCSASGGSQSPWPSGRSTSSSTAKGTTKFADATRTCGEPAAAPEPDRDRCRPHDDLEPRGQQPDHGRSGADHRQLHRAAGEGPRDSILNAGSLPGHLTRVQIQTVESDPRAPNRCQQGIFAGVVGLILLFAVSALLLPAAGRGGLVRPGDLGGPRRSALDLDSVGTSFGYSPDPCGRGRVLVISTRRSPPTPTSCSSND